MTHTATKWCSLCWHSHPARADLGQQYLFISPGWACITNRARVINSLKLLGYSPIWKAQVLREAGVKSKMKCWWSAEHCSSAASPGKDLSKPPRHSIKAGPTRHPVTGAADQAPCPVPLHEAQIPQPPQIQLRPWLAAHSGLWVVLFSIRLCCQMIQLLRNQQSPIFSPFSAKLLFFPSCLDEPPCSYSHTLFPLPAGESVQFQDPDSPQNTLPARQGGVNTKSWWVEMKQSPITNCHPRQKRFDLKNGWDSFNSQQIKIDLDSEKHRWNIKYFDPTLAFLPAQPQSFIHLLPDQNHLED